MAMMTFPYPELAVFVNWTDSNLFIKKYALDPRTELVLAVGIATSPNYIKNRPDMKTLGFTRNEKTFRNPNTKNILDFYAATPEELNREYFNSVNSVKKPPYNLSKNKWMEFPLCCGLSFLVHPLEVNVAHIAEIKNKLGIISVQPNTNIKEITHLIEVLDFVPAYYLKESTVFYKHLTLESLT